MPSSAERHGVPRRRPSQKKNVLEKPDDCGQGATPYFETMKGTRDTQLLGASLADQMGKLGISDLIALPARNYPSATHEQDSVYSEATTQGVRCAGACTKPTDAPRSLSNDDEGLHERNLRDTPEQIPGSSPLRPSTNEDEKFEPSPLIRQPETRPISQEELIAEVKAIYAGLTMVESKCIELNNAENDQFDTSSRLNNEQSEIWITQYRSLLRERNHILLACQHPSASPTMKKLGWKFSRLESPWKLPHDTPGFWLERSIASLELLRLGKELTSIRHQVDVRSDPPMGDLLQWLEIVEEKFEELFYSFDTPSHELLSYAFHFLLSSEFPGGKRPLCTTMPWTIRPALVVLWGDCWMFIMENPDMNTGDDGMPLLSNGESMQSLWSGSYSSLSSGISNGLSGDMDLEAFFRDTPSFQDDFPQMIPDIRPFIFSPSLSLNVPSDCTLLAPMGMEDGTMESLSISPPAASLVSQQTQINDGSGDYIRGAALAKVPQRRVRWQCHICGKSNFSRADALKRHMKSHDKPGFPCPDVSCEKSIPGKGFPRKDNLNRHIKLCHVDRSNVGNQQSEHARRRANKLGLTKRSSKAAESSSCADDNLLSFDKILGSHAIVQEMLKLEEKERKHRQEQMLLQEERRLIELRMQEVSQLNT